MYPCVVHKHKQVEDGRDYVDVVTEGDQKLDHLIFQEPFKLCIFRNKCKSHNDVSNNQCHVRDEIDDDFAGVNCRYYDVEENQTCQK